MDPFDLGPHAGFIIACYFITISVVAGLIAWVVLDRRQLNKALNELEEQGIKRARGNQAQS
ncbi:heme exporter protein CcmD [Roseibium sp. TrichSKD4]|uniref:heme exporter protein CcmD n=1 Tax=Roseibium sp. TrichSKD4 TaxID=744980 RepID=UPI0001E56C2B|nr:heme exporter protein CcmD [Roseibium sp. TrichSKD4]EFO32672.1 heme exporter protein CcmD [Roseibium sp. TrichSKD4]